MTADFFRDVHGAARLIAVTVCCLLVLEQKAMSDEALSESDRRNASAVRTLQEKNRDAIRWDASGYNIEAVVLHHDHGEALPNILEDLGEFPELEVISKALPREEDLDAICRLTFLKSLAVGWQPGHGRCHSPAHSARGVAIPSSGQWPADRQDTQSAKRLA